MKIYLLPNKNAEKHAFFYKHSKIMTSKSDNIDNDIALTMSIIGK